MPNNLKKYNEKRNFKKTNEPKGKINKQSAKLHFVVQHHLARKDHFDFRLEWNGTLKSWAVPKGPSYNPKDKRLAIRVEDHPIDYRNFEGTIPKGEYGGGTVMLWDEGYWEPTMPINKNFTNKTIKFILKGKRLKGAWNLIFLNDDNWLLIKEKDDVKGFKDIKRINKSIRTNRTMKEIASNTIAKEKIEITNPDKKIFPNITKLDIAKYYDKVSGRMLPLVSNRIISVIRAPEGINEEIFFKKHLENTNKGIGKINLKNEDNNPSDYYYIKNRNGLMSEVQMNSFEFHIWGSKVNTLEHPDMLVFDLDPDEHLSINKLREGVTDLKKILDELNLKSYLKTSGGKGYHVVVPINDSITWPKARKFAKNIALLMEEKWPNKYTSNIRKNKRKGKIFIDWIRNTRSSTFVAPYSLRLRENVPISMPIKWSDLTKIKPNEITIHNVDKYLRRKDPWLNFFD